MFLGSLKGQNYPSLTWIRIWQKVPDHCGSWSTTLAKQAIIDTADISDIKSLRPFRTTPSTRSSRPLRISQTSRTSRTHKLSRSFFQLSNHQIHHCHQGPSWTSLTSQTSDIKAWHLDNAVIKKITDITAIMPSTIINHHRQCGYRSHQEWRRLNRCTCR
jgi:hypothetical protein